ncbi:MAG: hypothetical protein KAH01_00350 [Caldisericia bacterium]|nr:hypothetical protein [Caldisericia bacterium]
MKKWLYMLLGVVVTLGGIWMSIHWWEILSPFLVGLAILFIFMAGVIILIVSFMIPAKEETFSDINTEEDEKESGCNLNESCSCK